LDVTNALEQYGFSLMTLEDDRQSEFSTNRLTFITDTLPDFRPHGLIGSAFALLHKARRMCH
jgi:hypothetical protein